MTNQFEEFQKISKEQLEQVKESAASVTRGLQAIATETTDFSKRSLENTSSFMEKLIGVKSVDTAIQLQSEFAKSQFEGFVAQATKIGDIYKGIAKDAFKPLEAAIAKGQAAVEQHSSLIVALVDRAGRASHWSLQAPIHLKGSTSRSGLLR